MKFRRQKKFENFWFLGRQLIQYVLSAQNRTSYFTTIFMTIHKFGCFWKFLSSHIFCYSITPTILWKIKVTASLKVKKALKWPWKVYLCDVNICSDPDFNSEKADFQAPLSWTCHRVPAMKKIWRPSLVSLLSCEKILCFL